MSPNLKRFNPKLKEKLSQHCIYLEDSGVSLFGGKCNVWGSPWQPGFLDFSFGVPDEFRFLKDTLGRPYSLTPSSTPGAGAASGGESDSSEVVPRYQSLRQKFLSGSLGNSMYGTWTKQVTRVLFSGVSTIFDYQKIIYKIHLNFCV